MGEVLFLIAMVALGILGIAAAVFVPIGVGLFVVAVVDADGDHGLFHCWIAGALAIAAFLLCVFFGVGFVRISWEAWA